MPDRQINIIFFLALALSSPCLIYAQDYQAKDFLKGRWYETEIIVFEYLSTLSVNEPEKLVINQKRSWPKDVRRNKFPPTIEPLLDPLADSLTATQPFVDLTLVDKIVNSLVVIDENCLGYPNLLRRDALHPNLIAAGVTPEKIDQHFSWAHKQTLESQENESTTSNLMDETAIFAEKNIVDLKENKLNLKASSAQDFISEMALFEGNLEQSSFSWLPNDTFILKDEYLAIRRAAGIRPVFHGRWRQSVPERNMAEPILILLKGSDSPKTLKKQLSKIEGLVHLTAKKFLHLNLELWYHADGLGGNPISFPSSLSNQNFGDEHMELKESRRMRSDELHYIDHPKMGVIAIINEVKIPGHLNNSLNKLLVSRIR